MSNIVVLLPDSELGHLFPTLKLARDLSERGHRIWYLGVPGTEKALEGYDFGFVPCFDEKMVGLQYGPLARGEIVDRVLAEINPDIFITLSIFCLEALAVKLRYRLPTVLVRHHCSLLNHREQVRSLIAQRFSWSTVGVEDLARLMDTRTIWVEKPADFADLLEDTIELVLFPQEFGSLEMAEDKKLVFAGSAVDLARCNTAFPWEMIDPKRPLLYCSLGTQARIKGDLSRCFFQLVIDSVVRRSDLELILSTGESTSSRELHSSAANVHVVNWAPQIEVLLRSQIMITHGGFGSIRECITIGVPMIVFPVSRDQFAGAERVIHHGIGIRCNITYITSKALDDLIETVLTVPSFSWKVSAMKKCFLSSTLEEAVSNIELVI
jgi:zeaxanthin glucosyltransferase